MREVLRLWAVLRPLQGRIIVMAVLTTVTALLGSSIPWFYRELINFLTNEQISAWLAWLVPEGASVVTTLFVLVAAYLGVLLVEDILFGISQYLSPTARAASWQMINLESLERIQRLSMSFFYARPAGAVFEKINAGAREGFRVIQIITIDIWPTLIRFAVAVWSVSILNMPMAIGLGGVMVLFAVRISSYKFKIYDNGPINLSKNATTNIKSPTVKLFSTNTKYPPYPYTMATATFHNNSCARCSTDTHK